MIEGETVYVVPLQQVRMSKTVCERVIGARNSVQGSTVTQLKATFSRKRAATARSVFSCLHTRTKANESLDALELRNRTPL